MRGSGRRRVLMILGSWRAAGRFLHTPLLLIAYFDDRRLRGKLLLLLLFSGLLSPLAYDQYGDKHDDEDGDSTADGDADYGVLAEAIACVSGWVGCCVVAGAAERLKLGGTGVGEDLGEAEAAGVVVDGQKGLRSM